MTPIYNKFYRLVLLLVLVPLLGDLHFGCTGGPGGGGGLIDFGGGGMPPPPGSDISPLGGGPTRGGGAAPGWQDGIFPERRPPKTKVAFYGSFCPADANLRVELWEKRENEDWKPNPTVETNYDPSTGAFEAIVPILEGESFTVKLRAFGGDCLAGETPEKFIDKGGKAFKGAFILPNFSQCFPSSKANPKLCLRNFGDKLNNIPSELFDASDSSSEGNAGGTEPPPPSPRQTSPKFKGEATDLNTKF